MVNETDQARSILGQDFIEQLDLGRLESPAERLDRDVTLKTSALSVTITDVLSTRDRLVIAGIVLTPMSLTVLGAALLPKFLTYGSEFFYQISKNLPH